MFPEGMLEDLSQLFAMVQAVMEQLGIWAPLGVFLTAVLIVRLTIVLYGMIRS